MPDWIFTQTESGLRLHRPGRGRLDFHAQATFPVGSSKRLAHQIRQDLWRRLQKIRGFTPVIEISDDIVRAGGQVDAKVPGNAVRLAEDVLNCPRNRARWLTCARLGVVVFALMVSPQLAQARTLYCVPQHPFFCGNMHVSCAGRSNIATRVLNIKLTGRLADVSQGAVTTAMQVREDRTALILRNDAPGYIRLLKNGRFAQRIYTKTGALMAIGQCETLISEARQG